MSREAPPIMRKLLIGQLTHIKPGSSTSSETNTVYSVPFKPNRQLLFTLIWLQGHVLDVSKPQSPKQHFLLDDGTGSILVTIQSDTQLPNIGNYVSVVGEIEKAESDLLDPFAELMPSIVAAQLNAKSVMCLTLADKQFEKEADAATKEAPSSAFAQLSWPLEVMDMSRTFNAPL